MVARRIRAVALAAAACVLTALTPTLVWASPSCSAVNAGALNFTVQFTLPDDPGPGGYTSSNPQTDFAAGDTINYAITITTNSGQIDAGFVADYNVFGIPSGFGNSPATEGYHTSHSGSYKLSSTEVNDIAFLSSGLYAEANYQRIFTGFTGTVVFAATCTPAGTPIVTSVSPTSGPTTGGTPVTITGTDFTGVTSVSFGATSVPSSSFTSSSSTQIVVPSPSGTAGTVHITVTNGIGTSPTSSADQFTYVTPLTTTQAVASTALTANVAATSFTPVTASGGAGTLTFALSGGTLPTGLTFSTSNGQISGTPTSLLPATTFTVTVTDQSTPTAQSSSKTFSLAVDPPTLTTTQAVPATTLTAGVAATSFTPVTASGGFGTLAFALSGGTLPTGLSFSTSTGLISGTPTTLLAATTFTVTVTDQTTPTAQTSSKTFSLTVNAATLTTTQAVPSTTLTANVAATSFTPVTASGGFGTLTFALSGGTLPTGLTFSTANGQISGTPTTLLSATTFTVTVTDQTTPTAQTSFKTFSLTVNPATLTTTQAVPSATLTANVAATPFTPVTASGGFGTLAFALSGGSLPTGLSFSTTTGQISGTPTTLLSATTLTVTVTDQTTPTAQTSSKTFSLTVNAATLTTSQAVPSTTLTANVAATSFAPVTAAGGFGTLTYALSGGSLPTGLSFSTTTGQILGTPTSLLSATTFTVTVTDQTTPTAQTSSKTFSLAVNAPPLTTTQAVASNTLTANVAATPFTPVTASGGFGTFAYALSGGSLPTGLTFSTTTGEISGTPTTLLSATTFTVTVTDQTTPTPQTSSKTFSLIVNAAPLTTSQAVPSTTLTANVAATSFAPVTAAGGFGTLTYALSGGSLPTGLSFSTTTGQITGTPATLLSATTFTVTVTDQTTPTAQTSFKTFSLTVNAAPLTTTQAVAATTLQVSSLATPFTPVTASGGFGTLTFALSGGSLPTGLTFSTTTGQISGTPTTLLSTTTFTVTVSDQTTPTAQSSSKTFSLAVSATPLTTVQAVASTTITVGASATPFTPVTASGGFGTLTFALSGGSLPTGLTFSTTTGQISGTPTTLLSATSFTVIVTDQTTPTAQSSSKTFSLTVNAVTLATTQAVASTALTANSAATPFTPVTASGGFGTLTYALSGGALPTGLTFSTINGQISGTPTTLLSATTFTVTVTDQTTPTAQSSSKTFSLTVNAVTLTTTQAVASTTLTANSAATPFTPVTASGGFGTLTYALSGGTLPTGLTFSTINGQISGTPTTLLPATTFTVTVTDQTTPTAQSSAKTFSLAVNAAALITTQAVASATLTASSAAPPFTPVTASGGFGTLSFALSGGSLPAGLTFSTTTGQISGTPATLLSATTFTVTVIDQTTPTPQSSSKTFSLAVNAATLTTTQAVAATTLTANSAATPFTPVTASGGFGTLSFALSGGSLPTGLTFSTTTGQILGTPTTLLPATTFTVTVTDQTTPTAQTSSNTFSLAVNAPALVTTQAVASTTLTANSAAAPFIPVTASGGFHTLSFALSGGTLPTGLTFSTSTGQISGTPSTLLTATTFTVTVTDQTTPTPQSSSKTFTLAVNASVLTTTQAVASVTLTSNAAATPVAPVTASGGFGTLSFALSGGSLPTGLTFSTTNGQIAGTPTALLSATTFTVTVTDQSTPTAQVSAKSFTLTVLPQPPVLTGVSPNSGPQTGGTIVTLTGTHLTGATAVTFGGTAAASVTVVNATTVTATAPAHAAGSVDVAITTPGGVATGARLYSYVAGPVVTSVSPASGPNLGGTRVTITGSNLTGATAVIFGGAAASAVTVASATSITAVTPAHAVGTVDIVVTTPAGSGTGNGLFSYIVPATTTSLTSSRNPSEAGQAVSFTATVTASGAVPTGTVTFTDGGAAIGSASLSGGLATFTTSTLSIGGHTIVATFAGNAGFGASASSPLLQSVKTPQDSLKLRALQIIATRTVAQTSGSAISGAIDTAISEGFADGGDLVTPSGMGLRFNFTDDLSRARAGNVDNAVSDRGNSTGARAGFPFNAATGLGFEDGRSAGRGSRSRIDDAFAAIDRKPEIGKAPERPLAEPKDWLMWAEIKGAGIGQWNATNANTALWGSQVNALVGLTRKPSANVLIGVVGGYETFDYQSGTLNGRLKGDGWTIGSYAAWRSAAGLRFDLAGAYSGIGYDGTAGAATGNFDGRRWLISGGITGLAEALGFAIEPSARVYALWERQNAYIDSLGTPQEQRDFFTGRASAGLKVSYPWLYSGTLTLAPYVGAFADYYFLGDNAETIALAGGTPLASVPLLDGWSARVTGGVAARFGNGAAVMVGGELGGLGGTVQIWTLRGRASVPF